MPTEAKEVTYNYLGAELDRFKHDPVCELNMKLLEEDSPEIRCIWNEEEGLFQPKLWQSLFGNSYAIRIRKTNVDIYTAELFKGSWSEGATPDVVLIFQAGSHTFGCQHPRRFKMRKTEEGVILFREGDKVRVNRVNLDPKAACACVSYPSNIELSFAVKCCPQLAIPGIREDLIADSDYAKFVG